MRHERVMLFGLASPCPEGIGVNVPGIGYELGDRIQ